MSLTASFQPQSIDVNISSPSIRTTVPESERVPVPGEQGEPGFSPIVSVEDIEGGHRVTITDADGDHTFDVMNGQNGRDGQDGQDGATGATPDIFTVGVTLDPGSTAYAHTSGTLEQPLITFGIPRGADGNPGQDGRDGRDGQDGAAASVAVGTVSGLPAGSDPTVTNSGTSSAAVLDFGIPKGDKGDKGEDADYELIEDTRSSNVAAMTGVSSKLTALKNGVRIMFHLVYASAASTTLNLTLANGTTTGAKKVYRQGTTQLAASIGIAGCILPLTYLTALDSGNGGWMMDNSYDSNTNTIGYQLRTNSTTLPTTDRTRYYRLLFESADGTKWIPANTQYDNSSTSTKTVNQKPINPFGRIVYIGNSTNYAANADIPATAIWEQYALVLGYSFNRTGAALTLATKTPVYIKCAPQTDGSAIMDDTTPFVQELPTTNDGKIYIKLGVAYDETHIELQHTHPVYYHNGTGIRLWTGGG